ncbi:AraC family transcriptional regulator [bacterium D16-51]|nr:AraC family transcriptional regulator [bacterium D16-59]RKI55654.1 AraC family transcriptional regulator [bacterium D16-51]
MSETIYPVIGNQVNLPVYLSGIGVAEPEYYIVREQGLISHQFLFTKNGRGIFKAGGNSYVQSSGSLFYLAPGIPHEYYPLERDWTTCWVVFRGRRLAELMEELGFKDWMVKDGINTEQFGQLFYRILAAARDSVADWEKCSVLLYEYILEVRKLLMPRWGISSKAGRIVEKAVQYIRENYREDITLEQLASASDVSLQHFCRVFKAQMGMRPMEYLAKWRISEAKKLLCSTNRSISEIGKCLGYSNLTYFGMVFKKYEGISPGQYRKAQGVKLLQEM